jgi:serine/threonine protein kinase
VWEAYDRFQRQLVALKVMGPESDNEGVPSTSIREISFLLEMNHPNIVTLFNVMPTDDFQEVVLVLELFETDLAKYLRDHRVGEDEQSGLLLRDIKFVLYQVLNAVDYLHQHKAAITHRDIKPQNIFLNPFDFHVKLGDLGLARNNSIDGGDFYFSPGVVTLWYRAPELLLGQNSKAAFMTDIWALGCVMAELYTSYPLFPGKDDDNQLELIAEKMGIFREEVWENVSFFPHYTVALGRYPLKEITVSLPAIKDEDGKDLLRSLLQCPTRKSARDQMQFAWFDDGMSPLSKIFTDCSVQSEIRGIGKKLDTV